VKRSLSESSSTKIENAARSMQFFCLRLNSCLPRILCFLSETCRTFNSHKSNECSNFSMEKNKRFILTDILRGCQLLYFDCYFNFNQILNLTFRMTELECNSQLNKIYVDESVINLRSALYTVYVYLADRLRRG